MQSAANAVQQPPGMSFGDIRTYLSAAPQPTQYAEGLVRSHGVDVKQDNDRTIVPIDICWRIFLEHANLLDDEMHCLTNGRLKRGGTTLLIARMLHCDTVFDAIQAYRDAAAIIVPGLDVSVTRRGAEMSLRWQFREDEGEFHHIALESIAVAYHAIFSWLIGERLSVLRVKAPADRAASDSTILSVLNAPVAYAGNGLEMILDQDTASTGILRRDIQHWQDGVYKILSSAAMRSCPMISGGAFAEQVREALLQGDCQKKISFEWGMSSKTIARRLAQEGTSFRNLRDEIRMEKSASLILAKLSVEEVGYLIGYQDTRSFRRAFARWFGVSPSVYRMQRSAI